MNPLKHLSFGSLRHGLSSVFHDLPDLRQPGKVNYPLHDKPGHGPLYTSSDLSRLDFSGEKLIYHPSLKAQNVMVYYIM